MGFIKQEPWYLSDLRPWPEWGADAWRHQALWGQRWELWDSEAAEVPHLVGGLEHLLFFHIYGISSSQLTNMFQRVETTNQSCFFSSWNFRASVMQKLWPFTSIFRERWFGCKQILIFQFAMWKCHIGRTYEMWIRNNQNISGESI